ncbi:hypothetical protein BOTU111921_05040 [Bordetella tumbae]|uniref:hypothetical protein n=1 Tax=Bordetella tumbae TaxID=1649139 RepID=UPI0039EDFB55
MSNPSSISTLSLAQISRVAAAPSYEEASKLTFLEKIIDWFQSGAQHEAIHALCNQIYTINRDSKSRNEMGRLECFFKLRDFVSPEYRDKFKFDFSQNPNESFRCSLTVGDTEIYRNSNILDYVSPKDKDTLLSVKYQMDLEDAFRNEDARAVYAVLQNISASGLEAGSLIDNALTDAKTKDQRAANSEIKIAPLPLESKEMLLSKVAGEFGNRIYAVVDFGERALMAEAELPYFQSDAMQPATAVSDSAPAKMKTQLQALTDTLREAARREHKANQEQKEVAMARSSFVSGAVKVGEEWQPDASISSPRPRLQSYRDLTEAETEVLSDLGVSDVALRLNR